MFRVKTLGVAAVSIALTFPAAAVALPSGVGLAAPLPQITIKRGRTRVQALRVQAGEELQLEVEGPTILELGLRGLGRKKKRKGATGHLTVTRDGTYRIEHDFVFPGGRGAKILHGGRGMASDAAVVQLEVLAGRHHITLALAASGFSGFAVAVRKAEMINPGRKLGPEVALAESRQTAPGSGASSDELPPLVARPPGRARRLETQPGAGVAPVAAVEEAQPVDATGSVALSGALIEVKPGDGTVAGETQALANAVAAAFARSGSPSRFHRVAVPYFQELGEDVEKNHLGKLVAEMLAAELGQRDSFVVVERERLDQVMREHRLADLGVVDDATAADVGKVLGAQSLISGTVGEAGPKYEITVKQVDVASGRVLAAGHVGVNRAGLIALSSEAVVTRSKVGALFRSALLPGWGQSYNDDTLKAVLFAGAGLATAGGGAGFWAWSLDPKRRYERGRPAGVKYRDVANDRIRIANALLIAYGVVWAVNMVDAYVSGRNFTTVEMTPGGAMARF